MDGLNNEVLRFENLFVRLLLPIIKMKKKKTKNLITVQNTSLNIYKFSLRGDKMPP